jgi:ribulose-5-phosphate 4-epimerase/fuculose-1-phosphate aldolase
MSVTALRQTMDPLEARGRVELAAAFRLAAMHDWHEAVANHFSLAIGAGGRRFLMNPRWMHFSRVRASDLLLLDAEDPATMERPDAPDPSAWCIHGRIHALLPEARCVLHVHPPYGTALACLADPTLPPIDQNSARYFRRVAVDTAYGGIADRLEEGERIARVLGGNRRLMMGNHGVLIVAPSVAEAYDDLYYMERAARAVVMAYSTGRPLAVLSDEVAEATARAWDADTEQGHAHFAEMCRVLDRRGEDYAS